MADRSLSRGIRKAKQDYTKKITSHFKDSRDTRSLWQGIQSITDYQHARQTCDDHISTLNDLHILHAPTHSYIACYKQTNTKPPKHPPPPPRLCACLPQV